VMSSLDRSQRNSAATGSRRGAQEIRRRMLVSEGDLIDKTQAELRSLHFRRYRDWLPS